jgi:hypothetical protein
MVKKQRERIMRERERERERFLINTHKRKRGKNTYIAYFLYLSDTSYRWKKIPVSIKRQEKGTMDKRKTGMQLTEEFCLSRIFICTIPPVPLYLLFCSVNVSVNTRAYTEFEGPRVRLFL